MAVANNRAPASTALTESHSAVFTALRKLLQPYESQLSVKTDKPGNCYLETQSASLNGRKLLFAGAKIKKNYVSFYLPALYMFPDLLERISPALKKMMQGQSCFNFSSSNQGSFEDCFEELGRLTQSGFERLKNQSLL